MTQATSVSTEKKQRKKRGDGVLPGLAKVGKNVASIGKEIARLQDEALAGTTKRMENNGRLVKLIRVAFKSYFEETIKSHPSLTEEDRAFLRTEYGLNC